LLAVVLGSFFVCQNVFGLAQVDDCATSSAWSSVKINEISSYTSSDWVELYNLSDVCVDLSGLKIWDSTTSSAIKDLKDLESSMINPNDWLWFNVSNRLNVGDDSVILKNEDQELDRLDYGGVIPAPQENEFIARSTDGLGSWIIFNTSTQGFSNIIEIENTAPTAVIEISTTTAEINEGILFSGLSSTDSDGSIVSWLWDFGDSGSSGLTSTSYSYSTTGTFGIFLIVTDDDNATSTATSSIYIFENTTTTPIIATTTPTTTLWEFIKINEVVSDPESGNEMVELFNTTSTSFDLLEGVICDSRETGCKNVSSTILGLGFLIIDLETASFLNNSGDTVILKDGEGNKIDEIIYGGSLDIPAKGESIARKQDGVDTDDYADWAVTTNITLGSANIISEPVSNSSSGGGGSSTPSPVVVVDDDVSDEQGGSPVCYVSSSVVIYEVFPNPKGDDSELEYIKIKNITSSTVNLAGWILKDKTKSFYLTGEILTEEILEFKRTTTSIALNNTSFEEVKLLDGCENVIDELSYEEAEEDFVLRLEEGERKWIFVGKDFLTQQGNIGDEEVKIIWDINYPQSILKGGRVLFDASGSADPRGGRLNYKWNFNSSTFLGNIQEFNFTSTGTFKIQIFATSTAGTVGQTELNIFVGERLFGEPEIYISEVLANPEGADVREYIKIKNSSTTTMDISGWELKYNGKVYQIPENSFINSGESLVFYKIITKFSLSNSGGKVSLWNSEKNLVNSFEFAKSGQGEIATEITEDYLAELVKKEVVKQSLKSKIKLIRNLSLEEIRNSSQKGDKVITKGAVVVMPNIFGSQYFYISDGKSGIQVYQHFKDFPELKVGDLVEIHGEVSQTGNIKRIKLKSSGDIKIIEEEVNSPLERGGGVLESLVIDKIDELGDEYLGSLVNIQGEITEIKTNYLYLDDGSSEIKVYFKPGSKITSHNFVVGENMEITGVLENTSSGLQVWPRNQDDIVISVSHSEFISDSQQLISENNSKEKAENYLVATGGGLTALILGFIARARGLMALGMLKKVVVAVGKVVIRRG